MNARDWHRDYVAESIKQLEKSEWSRDPSFEWLQLAIENARVCALAREIGRETGVQIVVDVGTTIQGIIASGRGRISHKQRFILARALAERFGTARAVAEHLWQLSDEEIDNADV